MPLDPIPPLIVFHTREGHGQAGAEIRSFALCRKLREKGIPAFTLSFRMLHSGIPESGLSFWDKIKLNAWVFRRLFALRPETLVLQRVNFHLPAALIYLLIFRPRFILDVDDWEFREDPARVSIGVQILRFLSRCAETTVTGSAFLEDYLKPFARNLKKIPSGVDTKAFLHIPTATNGGGNDRGGHIQLRCVWTGSLDLRPETFQEILCLTQEFARHAHPKLELWLLARGEKLPDLEAHLRNLNAPSIRLFPPGSGKQVADILRQCDVGLLPLFSDTRFNRAKSPVKLFEYAAAGLIPVCANRGEASILIRHNENGFLAEDAADMIRTLKRLAEAPPEELLSVQSLALGLMPAHSLERTSESWKNLLQNSSPAKEAELLEANEIPKCFQAASVAQRP